MKLKLLWYCTKNKPYLQVNKCVLPTEYDRYILDKKQHYSAFGEPLEKLNGKIVAESDFEVEEITKVRNYYDMKPEAFDNLYYTRTLDCEQLSIFSCMTTEQFDNYLKDKNGYAIHIKNLVADGWRDLEEFFTCGRDNVFRHVKRPPQNMMKVWAPAYPSYRYSYPSIKDEYVLISIRPEWACKILNGEKTIEVRKKVLKEMKE